MKTRLFLTPLQRKLSALSFSTAITIFGLTITFLSSCGVVKKENPEVAILGDWKIIEEKNINSHPTDLQAPTSETEDSKYKKGYSFLPDHICENKRGYYKIFEKDKHTEVRRIFIGTKTMYKIEIDSLQIFNQSDSTWTKCRIAKITSDTLTLNFTDGAVEKYVKVTYPEYEEVQFDQIIVSSTGLLDDSPVSDVSINNKGEVVYFGEKNTTANGFYISKMDVLEFTKIQNDFKKSNVKELQENYEMPGSSGDKVTVSFIKENRIIKTISDFGFLAPEEFYWAYTPLRYVHQKLPIQAIGSIREFMDNRNFRFENDNEIYIFPKSESFFLWNLFLQGQKSKIKFSPEYILKSGVNENLQEISTDGRYYSFRMKNGEETTLDLGHNFITENGIRKKFQNKNK